MASIPGTKPVLVTVPFRSALSLESVKLEISYVKDMLPWDLEWLTMDFLSVRFRQQAGENIRPAESA